MATGMTKKTNTFIPEVVAQMISAQLPKKITFTAFAKIDTTLQGTPGDTVTIPSWAYIGDAETVAEGAAIPLTQMTHSVKRMSIAKVGKGVELSDEVLLTSYGDPKGEAISQMVKSIASKLEEDVISALKTAPMNKDNSTAQISYQGIVGAVDMFDEEVDTEKVLFVHPKQITQLRMAPEFVDKTKYGNEVMVTGEIGMIAGCRVVKSLRVPLANGAYENFIVCFTPEPTDGTPVLPAVTIFLKRSPVVEQDRDIVHKSTVLTADQHYGVGLTNDSKVVRVKFKA